MQWDQGSARLRKAGLAAGRLLRLLTGALLVLLRQLVPCIARESLRLRMVTTAHCPDKVSDGLGQVLSRRLLHPSPPPPPPPPGALLRMGNSLRRGKLATRNCSLTTQMRLRPQRLASYMGWLMWQVRLYVNPHRPCMTMVFHLTVASDCWAAPALTTAAKRFIAIFHPVGVLHAGNR